MKSSDIDHIHEAGLISGGQRAAIIEHFKLDQESNKLLIVFSIVGGVLISAGIILLISSNWENIPRFVKLGLGLILLLGMHWGGWRLREKGEHPIIGDALHLIGSALFLGNIALIGQIYNLSSRPPNAILLWLAGIAPLPWILRSKAQHLLVLCGFGVWLGLEMNQQDSILYFGGEARQCMFYIILGVVFWGAGMRLRHTSFANFASATEKFGLLVLQISAYPLAFGEFYGSPGIQGGAWVLAGIFSALAIYLIFLSVRDKTVLPNGDWRLAWAAGLLGVLILAWAGLWTKAPLWWQNRQTGMHWIAIPALFAFCLLQIQVGVLRRSPWFINLAITFLGIYIITAYFELFGTMETTGLMFVVSGILLVVLAVFLERRRRVLIQTMRNTPPPPPPTPA